MEGDEYEEDMEQEMRDMCKRYDTGDIKLIMDDLGQKRKI